MSGAGEGYEYYEDGVGYAGGWPTGEADVDGPLDCETAVILRLADWLRSLVFQHTGDGSVFQFSDVVHEFPDEEQDLSGYPTAAVTLAGDSEESTYALTPVVSVERNAQGETLIVTANKSMTLQVDFWCRDRAQRRDVHRVVDNERAPSMDTGSLMLSMPKYHGIVARYNWKRSRRWDDDNERRTGEYRTTWWIDASCPVVRVAVLPKLTPTLYPEGQGSSGGNPARDIEVGPDVDPSI